MTCSIVGFKKQFFSSPLSCWKKNEKKLKDKEARRFVPLDIAFNSLVLQDKNISSAFTFSEDIMPRIYTDLQFRNKVLTPPRLQVPNSTVLVIDSFHRLTWKKYKIKIGNIFPSSFRKFVELELSSLQPTLIFPQQRLTTPSFRNTKQSPPSV